MEPRVYSKSVVRRLKTQSPIPFEAGRRVGITEVYKEYQEAADRLFYDCRWKKILENNQDAPDAYKSILKQKIDGYEWALHEFNRTFGVWLANQIRKWEV